MPMVSALSRRLHLLTADAKPDPPRSRVVDHPGTPQILDTESKCLGQSKSSQQTVGKVGKAAASEKVGPAVQCDSDKAPDEKPRANYKAKDKTKSRKTSCKVNVIKYNIINSHKVNIGSRTSYICNVQPYSNDTKTSRGGLLGKSEGEVMPESVEMLITCTDVINLEDMFLVKTHVGHGWIDIARKLDYSDGQIDQFEENHRHKGTGEVVYQILLDWKQSKTSEAQVGILASVAWSCQEYDCVKRWAADRRQRI